MEKTSSFTLLIQPADFASQTLMFSLHPGSEIVKFFNLPWSQVDGAERGERAGGALAEDWK